MLNYEINYRFFDKSFQGSNGKYFKKNDVSNNEAKLNRDVIEKTLGVDFLALVNQVHGQTLYVVKDRYDFGNEPVADALITNRPNIALGIITADCVPVLLYCSSTNVIAAAHCGWKSARSNLIKNVIDNMKEIGTSEITAIIGPSITQNSYEVSEEFRQDFLSELITNDVFFKQTEKSDKFLFDLPGYVIHKLKTCGVNNIIDGHNEDTYSNIEKYHSRRRSFHANEDYSGNLLSTIMIKPC